MVGFWLRGEVLFVRCFWRWFEKEKIMRKLDEGDIKAGLVWADYDLEMSEVQRFMVAEKLNLLLRGFESPTTDKDQFDSQPYLNRSLNFTGPPSKEDGDNLRKKPIPPKTRRIAENESIPDVEGELPPPPKGFKRWLHSIFGEPVNMGQPSKTIMPDNPWPDDRQVLPQTKQDYIETPKMKPTKEGIREADHVPMPKVEPPESEDQDIPIKITSNNLKYRIKGCEIYVMSKFDGNIFDTIIKAECMRDMVSSYDDEPMRIKIPYMTPMPPKTDRDDTILELVKALNKSQDLLVSQMLENSQWDQVHPKTDKTIETLLTELDVKDSTIEALKEKLEVNKVCDNKELEKKYIDIVKRNEDLLMLNDKEINSLKEENEDLKGINKVLSGAENKAEINKDIMQKVLTAQQYMNNMICYTDFPEGPKHILESVQSILNNLMKNYGAYSE